MGHKIDLTLKPEDAKAFSDCVNTLIEDKRTIFICDCKSCLGSFVTKDGDAKCPYCGYKKDKKGETL